MENNINYKLYYNIVIIDLGNYRYFYKSLFLAQKIKKKLPKSTVQFNRHGAYLLFLTVFYN